MANPNFKCEGEMTIAMRSAEHLPVKLFGNWRCPHTQSVWVGLEEKCVDFEWFEIDLYKRENGSRQRWLSPVEDISRLYPAFIKCSPSAKIPALDNNGEHVKDSLIALEYINEAFTGPPLLPTAPRLRARVRLWARHVESQVVPHYERLLAMQDAEGRAQARSSLQRGLVEFEQAMAPETEGPFFLGDDFSIVDIALAPWWQRMCTVARAYRKFDPSKHPRLQLWFEAMEARPSFKRTMVDPERIIEDYSEFVDFEETSKFTRFSVQKHAGSVAPSTGRRSSEPAVSTIS